MYNCGTPFLSAVSEVFVKNSNSGVCLNKKLPSDFQKYICCMSKTHDKYHVNKLRCRYCVGGNYCRVTKNMFELNRDRLSFSKVNGVAANVGFSFLIKVLFV